MVDDPLVFVKPVKLLREIADFNSRPDFHAARIRLDKTRDDFQKRSLSRSVLPNDADAVVTKKIIGKGRKYRFPVIAF